MCHEWILWHFVPSYIKNKLPDKFYQTNDLACKKAAIKYLRWNGGFSPWVDMCLILPELKQSSSYIMKLEIKLDK